MKEYIITVIGATVLSAMANILSPDSWRKYIGVITGFIIISCIIAPVSKLADADLFSDFDEFYEDRTDYKQVERNFIIKQLEGNIEEDIEKRFKDEFNDEVSAVVDLEVNENNEIEGVSHIKITGCDGALNKTERLCEIYGIKRDEVEYE